MNSSQTTIFLVMSFSFPQYLFSCMKSLYVSNTEIYIGFKATE